MTALMRAVDCPVGTMLDMADSDHDRSQSLAKFHVRAARPADAAAIGEVHAEAWLRAYVAVFDLEL